MDGPNSRTNQTTRPRRWNPVRGFRLGIPGPGKSFHLRHPATNNGKRRRIVARDARKAANFPSVTAIGDNNGGTGDAIPLIYIGRRLVRKHDVSLNNIALATVSPIHVDARRGKMKNEIK